MKKLPTIRWRKAFSKRVFLLGCRQEHSEIPITLSDLIMHHWRRLVLRRVFVEPEDLFVPKPPAFIIHDWGRFASLIVWKFWKSLDVEPEDSEDGQTPEFKEGRSSSSTQPPLTEGRGRSSTQPPLAVGRWYPVSQQRLQDHANQRREGGDDTRVWKPLRGKHGDMGIAGGVQGEVMV